MKKKLSKTKSKQITPVVSPSFQKNEILKDNFIEKIAKAIVSYPSQLQSGTQGLTTTLQRPGMLSYDVMLRIYERSALVRMVVDTKTKIISGLDWDVVSKKGYDVPEEVLNKAREFMRKPNSDDTHYSFIVKILTDLGIYDAVAIEKVKSDVDGSIVELVPIDASTIVPVVNNHGQVTEYRQVVKRQNEPYGIKRTNAQTQVDYSISFSPDEIIYFHEYPSTNRIYGRSPLETLTIEVATDLYALGYNANWFVEGFLFTKILAVPKLGEGERERLEAIFNIAKGKPKELPILEVPPDSVDKTKILDLGFKNKDMEFMSLEDWLFKRICGVYQISPNDVVEVKQYATKASAATQREIADSKGFKPIVKLLEDVFTDILEQKFGPGIRFDIVPERIREQDKIEMLKNKVEAGVPLNDALEEAGMDRIEVKLNVGDMMINPYDYPSNLIDLFTEVESARTAGVYQLTDTKISEIIKSKKKISKPIELKVKWYKRDEANAELKEKIGDIFDKVKSSLKSLVKKRPVPADIKRADVVAKQDIYSQWSDSIALETLIDSEFKDEFEKRMRAHLKDVIKKSAEQTLSQLGISIADDMWDKIASDYYKKRFYDKGVLFNITDTLRQQIGSKLSEAYQEGATIKEMFQKIEQAIDDMRDWEAERIARTENMMAATSGMMDTWKGMGVRQWALKVFPGACPLCQAIANGGSPSEYGEWKKDDVDFHGNPYSEDEMKYLEQRTHFSDWLPHPNCEDVWVPYIEEDEKETVLNNAKRLQAELMSI